MRENIAYLAFFLLLTGFVGVSYLSLTAPPVSIQSSSLNEQKEIQSKLIPDDSFVLTEVGGQGLSELSVLWWTWVYSIPRSKVSPVIDPDGKSCGFNQHGDVWFLAGSPGDNQRYVRDCNVPKGKFIFFPIITLISTTKAMCPDAILQTEINSDLLSDIEIVLDDKIIPDPRKFRARSPDCFRLKGYVKGEFSGLGVYPVASDGYWILMKPLEPGAHHLHFKAKYKLRHKDVDQKPDFVQDIVYNLSVQ